ncbi:MAG: SDR family oxidoreductase [Chloroflexi bacterium]|nr:SDR family oxidoreductase [Chloroflexota bacterium]
MQLDDQVAIITGGSKGIGRAIADAYAAEGCSVVIAARTQSDIDVAVSEISATGGRAIGVQCDVSDESSVAKLVGETLAKFGRIDILVNNAAAIHGPIPAIELDLDTWRMVVDVNLTGSFICAKAVLPSMYEQGSGKLINISSIGGRKGGWGRAAYRSTKAGLISLTETLAAESKEHGVDVNCICPGGTDTEMIRIASGGNVSPDWVKAEEIATVALFLAGSGASAITGESIDVFGKTNPLFRGR